MPVEPGLGMPLFGETGKIRVVEGAQRLRELILTILLTRKGERVMRPEFGSDLMNLAFKPVSTALQHEARESIVNALSVWEPRVEVIDVVVEPTGRGMNGLLNVRLRYRINQENVTDEISIRLGN